MDGQYDPSNDRYNLQVEIEQSIKTAKKMEKRMIVDEGDDGPMFQAPVCIICDGYIKGVEKICAISKQQLQYHIARIGVESYEDYYGQTLKKELVEQYEVEGLEGLLLSIRSRCGSDGKYTCCESCMNSMKPSNITQISPPKRSIANGFVIGHIPTNIKTINSDGIEEVTKLCEEDLTDILCSFLSPTRAYGYVFAYSGGAHKSIKGHFSFYELDIEKIGGGMNYFHTTGANPHVYCVLCGRMTPKQKELARARASLDTKMLTTLLTWFALESGHPGYENIRPPSECPSPTIIEDPSTDHNTDEEHDSSKETTFEGATFHFTSNHDPDNDTSVHETNHNLVMAMLKNTMPTLLVHGGDYANLKELLLENVCAVQFPFGLGGPKMHRRNRISPSEIYKHYCNISLSQFQRGDFLLILKHMHNRILSFQKALIKCKSKSFGRSLSERVSELDIDTFEQAGQLSDLGHNITGTAGDFLRTVKACCQPIGHSAEAAKYHRRLHFALDDFFGGCALFLTITPCDECTFRVRLFAEAGKAHSLPPLCDDPNDAKGLAACLLDFNLRKKQRSMYPGACSLVYQHLMQIVLRCLLGWLKSNMSLRRSRYCYFWTSMAC